jgi:hypothetical protein
VRSRVLPLHGAAVVRCKLQCWLGRCRINAQPCGLRNASEPSTSASHTCSEGALDENAEAEEEESVTAREIRLRFEAAIADLYSTDPRNHVRAAAALDALASPLTRASNPFRDIADFDALDVDSRNYVADAACWLAVLSSSGLLAHAVPEDGARSRALLQAAADVHSAAAHMALAYRHETGYLEAKSCNTAYAHLKARRCFFVFCLRRMPAASAALRLQRLLQNRFCTQHRQGGVFKPIVAAYQWYDTIL